MYLHGCVRLLIFLFLLALLTSSFIMAVMKGPGIVRNHAPYNIQIVTWDKLDPAFIDEGGKFEQYHLPVASTEKTSGDNFYLIKSDSNTESA